MSIALHLEPAERLLPPVRYHWDAETEILSATLASPPPAPALADAVATGAETLEVSGTDGSWLMLDVRAMHLHGVEVAVWPAVRRRAALLPPIDAVAARASVAEPAGEHCVSAVVSAESDQRATTLHFRVGRAPVASTVRLGGDLLLDLDARSRLAGLWLLNVPPAPPHA
jgi:hypothetical protein